MKYYIIKFIENTRRKERNLTNNIFLKRSFQEQSRLKFTSTKFQKGDLKQRRFL